MHSNPFFDLALEAFKAIKHRRFILWIKAWIKFDSYRVSAEEILSDRKVKELLCPAMSSLTDNAVDIFKKVAPVLITLNLTGTVQIELDAYLYATIILLISKMGVSSICADITE